MAINKNHEFEELDGVKCSIVEKNASKERVDFLKQLLEFNRFTVVVIPTPPPKAVPAKPSPKPVVAEGAEPVAPPPPLVEETPPPPPSTFIIGVTDLMFNPTNAIFGRLLRTPGMQVVTLAYWEQKESESKVEVPYYEKRKENH